MFEVGYPTSSVLGGTELKQAEFIKAVFRSWDKYRVIIPYMSFYYMHDLTAEQTQFYVDYYGFGGFRLGEYLRTMGLRNVDGVDKEGIRALKDEAKKRGW